jgi:hypothetical protein
LFRVPLFRAGQKGGEALGAQMWHGFGGKVSQNDPGLRLTRSPASDEVIGQLAGYSSVAVHARVDLQERGHGRILQAMRLIERSAI